MIAGSHHSEESKRRIAIAHLGMRMPPFTEEWHRKLSVAHQGLSETDETKKKLGDIRKRWWDSLEANDPVRILQAWNASVAQKKYWASRPHEDIIAERMRPLEFTLIEVPKYE